MGWTIHHEARRKTEAIERLVASANPSSRKLSEDCKPYFWNIDEPRMADGFTKIAFSSSPEEDYRTILSELGRLAAAWNDVRITISDDFVLSAGADVRDVDEQEVAAKLAQ